jgi:DNA polymerase III delta prime subunit
VTGKTCLGVNISEAYKQQCVKYGTKIHILVSGPLIKESWRSELLKCTGETYLKEQDKTVFVSEAERQRARKNAINIALQYYRFMSYRSFYKKVLGEKIVERVKTDDEKVRVTYRKTKEGDFERDIALDRIYNLNNSVIVIDEAHNLTGNAYGEALAKIIKNSHNLRVILLTATPMKNLGDDIVELINFIRPPDKPMLRDKIFTSHKNHEMQFKPGGLEYLKEMTRGYVSYLRGADPITFAKRVEKGVKPPSLLFTTVIRCKMLPFQNEIYEQVVAVADDTLDRRSEAVANFAFPGLSNDKKELIGYFGREGLEVVKNQLKTHYDLINKKVASDILQTDETDLITLTDDGKTITGKILKYKNLKYFSIKFYRALRKLSRLVWSKKGAKTAFVYSNLVKVGIELFQEILIQNGFLEFDETPSNYKIKPDTVCYYCGKTYRDHQQNNLTSAPEEDPPSTEYKLKTEMPPPHQFHPATFISVTGKTSEEAADVIPEDKKLILDNVFSNIENKEGKNIKFVLGSKVMSEAISLKNVAEVHILDVYFNLGKVDQVIGRAIRHCSHYQVTNDENRYPEVSVYKYAVTVENGLSSEEELYKKAEQKYMLIKKVERALKEVAIDCPLNRNGNIFPEELEKFKNCVEPNEELEDIDTMCPARCDYTKCNFLCDDPVLNQKYYDAATNSYRKIPKDKLDYSTFTHGLARNEIELAKSKIKDIYRIKYVYTLSEIVKFVKDSYDGEKKELFDEFFVFKALDELIPITENDFNNFKDTIFDKFNRPGYLIYVYKYYIFQPFDQNPDVPMYYRSTFDRPMKQQLMLYNYLKNSGRYKTTTVDEDKAKEKELAEALTSKYDFESVMDYYDGREEFKYVGVIDKESSRKKSREPEELADVFKLRAKRARIILKRRESGLSSFFGAVGTSKSKTELEDILTSLGLKIIEGESRADASLRIKHKMLFLEKYTEKPITYVIIPKNHPILPFPYNYLARIEYIRNQIKDKIKFKLDIKVDKAKKPSSYGEEKGLPMYTMTIKGSQQLKDFDNFLTSLGFKTEGNTYKYVIDY